MNKKVIAILAAGVLAVLGIGALALWAGKAQDRAYEGAELVSVVQVQSQVPKGTTTAELGSSVKTVKLPSSAVPKGAVKQLSDVAGRVTSAQLEPGEVLLSSRLVDPEAEPEAVGGVPRGLQEMSLSLEAQRLVGGRIEVGDTVGVLASYQNPADFRTKLIANRVVVTRIDTNKTADSGVAQSIVTLALTSRQVELVTNASEFGKIWLTKQNKAATTAEGRSVDPKDVVR